MKYYRISLCFKRLWMSSNLHTVLDCYRADYFRETVFPECSLGTILKEENLLPLGKVSGISVSSMESLGSKNLMQTANTLIRLRRLILAIC